MEERGLAKAGRVTGIVGGSLMLLSSLWGLVALALFGSAAGASLMMSAGPLEQSILAVVVLIAVVLPLVLGGVALALSIRYPMVRAPQGIGGPVGVLICGVLGLMVGAGFGLGALGVLVAGILLLIDANGEHHQAPGQAPPV